MKEVSVKELILRKSSVHERVKRETIIVIVVNIKEAINMKSHKSE